MADTTYGVLGGGQWNPASSFSGDTDYVGVDRTTAYGKATTYVDLVALDYSGNVL
jgi:hypothetical protein